jgi:hypothetical protein
MRTPTLYSGSEFSINNDEGPMGWRSASALWETVPHGKTENCWRRCVITAKADSGMRSHGEKKEWAGYGSISPFSSC